MLRRRFQLLLPGQPRLVWVLPSLQPQIVPDGEDSAHGHVDPPFRQAKAILAKFQQIQRLRLQFHRPLARLLVELIQALNALIRRINIIELREAQQLILGQLGQLVKLSLIFGIGGNLNHGVKGSINFLGIFLKRFLAACRQAADQTQAQAHKQTNRPPRRLYTPSASHWMRPWP